jgi:hypothetical protein
MTAAQTGPTEAEAIRVDSISADDRPVPDGGADLTCDSNWYDVHVPVLNKTIMGNAVAYIVGLSLGVAAILPLGLIPFGWW